MTLSTKRKNKANNDHSSGGKKNKKRKPDKQAVSESKKKPRQACPTCNKYHKEESWYKDGKKPPVNKTVNPVSKGMEKTEKFYTMKELTSFLVALQGANGSLQPNPKSNKRQVTYATKNMLSDMHFPEADTEAVN